MEISVIVNPSEKDFIRSIKLLNQVFHKSPSHTDYSAKIAYERTSKSNDTAIFEVLDENHALVGFAYGYERYPGYYHIWQLGVDEKSRGKGIASSLYDKIEKFAKEKNYKGITLNTFNVFKANIRLIINRGYQIYDLDKNGKFKADPKIMLHLDFSP